MKILRKPEVVACVGYSAMQISRLEKADKFPKRIRLGPNAVGWFEHEIDEWLAERAKHRGPLPPRVAAGAART